MTLILALLCQLPPAPEEPITPAAPIRKIVIYLDDSPRSNLLRAELTGNWNRNGTPAQIEWQRRQAAVLESVEIVEHRRYELASYPRWARSRYQGTNEFDPRAFSDSGMALMTIEVILFNENVDLSDWKHQCKNAIGQAEHKYVREGCKWIRENDAEEIPVIEGWYNMWIWGVPDNVVFPMMRERYKNRGNFPAYVEPELPPKPFRAWPWEPSSKP